MRETTGRHDPASFYEKVIFSVSPAAIRETSGVGRLHAWGGRSRPQYLHTTAAILSAPRSAIRETSGVGRLHAWGGRSRPQYLHTTAIILSVSPAAIREASGAGRFHAWGGRSRPQYLHTTAAILIVSAQKGQVLVGPVDSAVAGARCWDWTPSIRALMRRASFLR